jgi:hypothetical protein
VQSVYKDTYELKQNIQEFFQRVPLDFSGRIIEYDKIGMCKCVQNAGDMRRPEVKSLCLTKHHIMRTYWGSGGTASRILDLGTRWR